MGRYALLRLALLVMLGAALAGCEGGAPASPTPVGPTPAPTPPGTPLPAATAVPGAGTPAAPPTAAPPGEPGLMYLANGDLTFYSAVNHDTWRMVPAGTDPGVTARIVTFAVDPGGTRLAYLLVRQQQDTSGCRVESQIWLVDLRAATARRVLADAVLPASCAGGPAVDAVLQGLAFAPDGARLAYLAAADPAGPVSLWDVASAPRGTASAPRRLVAPQAGLLLHPAWDPTGARLAFLEAADLGTSGSYDANLAVVDLPMGGAAAAPRVLVQGHALPGGQLALPPFDLTWLDATRLAFQAWDPHVGPDGAWVVDAAGGAAPRAIAAGQAGLGAWSPAGPALPRLYAYRVAGRGLAVSAGTPGDSALLATDPGVGATGAIPPIWSGDGAVVAYGMPDGAIHLAARAAPGAPVALDATGVVAAAWSADPAAPPRLAVVARDGRQVVVYDGGGRRVAAADLPDSSGSPQDVAWAVGGADLLAVRYAGGTNDQTAAMLLTLDAAQGRLTTTAGPAADDAGPLVWVRLGPIREP